MANKKITVICECKKCGKEFHPNDSARRLYCSRECRVADRKINNCVCKSCGKRFVSKCKDVTKYCSVDCWLSRYENRPKGKKSANWKYGCKEYFREIARNVVGQKGDYNTVVHHIDGNVKNNETSNLQIMSRSEHTKLHWLQGDLRRSHCNG